MSDERKSEYWVPFKGCKPLNKKRANQVGFMLICGFLAATIAALTVGRTILSVGFVFGVTLVSYLLGKRLFRS